MAGCRTHPMTVQEIWMCGIDIAGLHPIRVLVSLIVLDNVGLLQTYATMSDTNFVVGAIDFLKKLTTTELKRSRRAG